MTVRTVHIDGALAEEADCVAEASGLTLEEFVMVLLEEELNRIERTIAVHNEIDDPREER